MVALRNRTFMMFDPEHGNTDEQRADRPPSGSSHARTLSLLVRGKNINEKTLLATDYLNHFNEIIMLLDMVSGMPDFLEDAKEWAPKSYVEHFRDSSFAEKELAIFAYENAPEAFRRSFDHAVARMNRLVAEGLTSIEQAVEARDEALIAGTIEDVTGALRTFVDVVSAIIHGDQRTVDQSEVDAILDA